MPDVSLHSVIYSPILEGWESDILFLLCPAFFNKDLTKPQCNNSRKPPARERAQNEENFESDRIGHTLEKLWLASRW